MNLDKEISIGNSESIETLFKVEPPLTTIENGFGYIGVVLRNKDTDKLQCHICGEWFTLLINHVKSHQINGLEYRKKFGLPLSFPLCSISYSKKFSELGQTQERKERCRDIAKISQEKAQLASRNKKNRANWLYGFNNPARDNMYAACFEQLKKRYEIVADIVGHDPSRYEIDQHDKSLSSAIYRRYGSINKFRKKAGYEIRKQIKPCETSQIIAKIIKFFEENKRPPTTRDFKSGVITMNAIYNHFGSFKRALSCAGIDEHYEREEK